MSIIDNEAKGKSGKDRIARWSLFISILALIISGCTFLLNINNHPLIVEFVGYGLKTIKNDNNIHTPTLSDDAADNPPYIAESNAIDLTLKKRQGNISKVYMVDYTADQEPIYTQVNFNKGFDKITVEVPLKKEETIVEDADYYENKAPYNAPRLQSFVLAFIDYNNNMSVYYIVLRPRPVFKDDSITFTNYSINGELKLMLTNIENWKYDVAFIDCSKTNVASIRKSILDRFNLSSNSDSQFQYDENKNEYLNSFSLYPERTWGIFSTTVSDKPKVIVIHDSLDIERDYELIKAVMKDK